MASYITCITITIVQVCFICLFFRKLTRNSQAFHTYIALQNVPTNYICFVLAFDHWWLLIVVRLRIFCHSAEGGASTITVHRLYCRISCYQRCGFPIILCLCHFVAKNPRNSVETRSTSALWHIVCACSAGLPSLQHSYRTEQVMTIRERLLWRQPLVVLIYCLVWLRGLYWLLFRLSLPVGPW